MSVALATGCSALPDLSDIRFSEGDGGQAPKDGSAHGGMDASTPDAGTDAGRSDGGLDAAVVVADGGVDAFVPRDAGAPDSGPLVCLGSDNGGSDRARWPMPTESPLGLSTTQSLTVSGPTVVDDVTELIWQRGTSPASLTQSDAIAYCRDLSLAGCDDWRLPSMIELLSITDLTTADPSIDATAFPSTPSDLFWTSTVSVSLSSHAWVLSFIYSDPNTDDILSEHQVRCVRDPHPRTPPSFTTDTDTVTDNGTGLTWERNPSTTEYSAADADTHCAGLSLGAFGDWRVPSRNELLSIVDTTASNPAIDTASFGFPSGANYFWSASTDANSLRPWFVAFSEGGVPYSDPISMAAVRCVR